MIVYLLWVDTDDEPGEGEVLIGVYGSYETAQKRADTYNRLGCAYRIDSHGVIGMPDVGRLVCSNRAFGGN